MEKCNVRFVDAKPEEGTFYIAISEDRYKELLKAEMELCALNSGGVDNWEWYGESKSDYLNFLRNECYDRGTLQHYIEARKAEDETVEEYLEDMYIKDFAEFEVAII